MTLTFCCVPTCSNIVSDHSRLNFHYLPTPGGKSIVTYNKDGHKIYRDKRELWLERIKVPDTGCLNSRIICSEHFTDNDYFKRSAPAYSKSYTQVLLKPNAVPSVNLPPDDYDHSSKKLIATKEKDWEKEFDNLMHSAGAETLKNLVNKMRNYHLERMYDMLFGEMKEEWIRAKPTLGGYVYTCYACRHLFSSFNILQDHLNVRILVLKFKCSGCENRCYKFYNPCVLLLHMRSHFTSDSNPINLNDIQTDILPVELAGFFPIPEVPVLYEKEEEMLTDNTYIDVQFYSPKRDQRGQNIVELEGDTIVFVENNEFLALKQVCKNVPKCQFITIEEHNQLKESYEATIKEEISDYVEQFTLPVISKVETVQEQPVTLMPTQCIDCKKSHYEDSTAMHYQGSQKPTDLSLTCDVCNFIAPTNCAFLAHCRIHTNTPPHVCPECGIVFDNFEDLLKHLNNVCFHLAKQVKMSCPAFKCRKLFSMRKNFILHFKNTHFNAGLTCVDCRYVTYSAEEGAKHHNLNNGNCNITNIYTCEVCKIFSASNESEMHTHAKFHHSQTDCNVYVFACTYCRKIFRSDFTYSAHLLRCPSRISVSSEAKPRLVKTLSCVLCKEKLSTEEQVRHKSSCKYANPVVIAYNLSESYINAIIDGSNHFIKSPKSNDCLEFTKKRRKRYLTDISKRRRPESHPDLIAEKPMTFDGTYHCQLCDYSNDDRSDFHVHIRTHREISSPYQCMECGECFVVKPTLFKHLRHYHNISDHDYYLKCNDCFDTATVNMMETSA
uniref:Transcriptional repressor CTCFL-like n=1 Tax=Diabrotica virgifera virgifera TaxID=50390 RepID=A0A6P7FD03_DIAVI